MNDIIQNTITEVFTVEDSGTQIKLKDKNKRSLGSFFKAKKDGNPTMAYQQFQDMEIKSGLVVEIGFKEVPYKDGVIKNIISFREAAGRPVERQQTQNSAPQQEIEPLPEEYPTQQKANGQDAFGRRLAIHGLINGMLAGGYKVVDFDMSLIEEVGNLEDKINKYLN